MILYMLGLTRVNLVMYYFIVVNAITLNVRSAVMNLIYEGMMLRILAFSDIHGNWKNLQSVMKSEIYDIVLIAGDLSDYSGKVDKVIKVVMDFIKDYGVATYMVLGNIDDPKLFNELSNIKEIVVLHGSITKRSGYVVIGLSGGLYSPFHTYFELSDEEYRELLDNVIQMLSSLKNDQKLIFLTHTPPYNTKVDLTYDGSHVGSESVRKFIEEYQPLITVCGHIHEGRGVDRINNSLILNPGPLFKGFYAIINVDDEVIYELKTINRL